MVADGARTASGRTGQRQSVITFPVGRVVTVVGIFDRFIERRGKSDGGNYVCTLCGATFEERTVVVCPKCRGFVVKRGQ